MAVCRECRDGRDRRRRTFGHVHLISMKCVLSPTLSADTFPTGGVLSCMRESATNSFTTYVIFTDGFPHPAITMALRFLRQIPSLAQRYRAKISSGSSWSSICVDLKQAIVKYSLPTAIAIHKLEEQKE